MNIYNKEEVSITLSKIVDSIIEDVLIGYDHKVIDFEFHLKELIPDKVETFCERLNRVNKTEAL